MNKSMNTSPSSPPVVSLETQIDSTYEINIDNMWISLLSDKSEHGLHFYLESNNTIIKLGEPLEIMNNSTNFSIYIAVNTQPNTYDHKYIFCNDSSFTRYYVDNEFKEFEVSLNNKNRNNTVITDDVSENYIIMCDDYFRFLLELADEHLESIECLKSLLHKDKDGESFN